MSDEMDVVWTKTKLKKMLQKGTMSKNVQACGDASSSCCKLCGGVLGLQTFADTCICEGNEERCDHVIYECYGLTINSPDWKICEGCVQQLCSARLFKTMVQAALNKRLHDYTPSGPIDTTSYTKRDSSDDYDAYDEKYTAKTKAGPQKPKKAYKIPNSELRRVNVACAVCKQKYPMLMAFSGTSNFICSRCKKNQSNKIISSLATSDEDGCVSRNQLGARKRSRLSYVVKKPSPLRDKRNYSPEKAPRSLRKIDGNQSSSIRKNANPTTSFHGDATTSFICAVCEKELKSKKLLEKHLQTHTGEAIHQCEVCMRVFKSKKALQNHCMCSHGNLISEDF